MVHSAPHQLVSIGVRLPLSSCKLILSRGVFNPTYWLSPSNPAKLFWLNGGSSLLASNNNDLGVSPVVPNSLVRITSDKECVLYTIVVLKSQRKVSPIGDIQEWEIADSFRTACRKKRYVLRDKFKLDLEATKKAMHYQAQLDSDYNLYEGKTLEWCKVHFGETMIAWAHVKAIRVFIESV